MNCLNVEFKARCEDHNKIREILLRNHANFIGEDHQVDTYFNVPEGRLKLREGNIENNLIYYERADQEGPTESCVRLHPTKPGSKLKDILTNVWGLKVAVDKRREIYFIGNVKFHLDRVEGLGSFVEVEAIDYAGMIGRDNLQAMCEWYLHELGIQNDQLVSGSYSDLLLERMKRTPTPACQSNASFV